MTMFTDSRSQSCSLSFGPLVEATFLRRDNRFRVQVRIGAQTVAAHLANSGRLGELLVPGHRVWLTPAVPAAALRRKTGYDLTLVDHHGHLVSVDSRLPGDLAAQALRCNMVGENLKDYPNIKREVALGQSRIDYFLSGPDRHPCWLEVKSVTLVTDKTARFPDAPTARGRRHLDELSRAVLDGDRAAVLFVVQRDDARQFTPNDTTDPEFGRALRHAASVGVEVYALSCRLSLESITVDEPIPVILT
jgi:sugar fermentation stimulation protein A